MSYQLFSILALGLFSSQVARAAPVAPGKALKLATDAVRSLDPGVRIAMEAFMAGIVDANTGYNVKLTEQNIPEQNIVEGIIALFAERRILLNKRNLLDGADGFTRYKNEFKRTVVGLCSVLNKKFSPLMSYFDGSEMLHGIDSGVLQWTAKVKVCRTVLANTDSFIQRTHSILAKKYPNKPFRFLGLFENRVGIVEN